MREMFKKLPIGWSAIRLLNGKLEVNVWYNEYFIKNTITYPKNLINSDYIINKELHTGLGRINSKIHPKKLSRLKALNHLPFDCFTNEYIYHYKTIHNTIEAKSGILKQLSSSWIDGEGGSIKIVSSLFPNIVNLNNKEINTSDIIFIEKINS